MMLLSKSSNVLGLYSFRIACFIEQLYGINIWAFSRGRPPVDVLFCEEPLSPTTRVLWVIVLVKTMSSWIHWLYIWYKSSLKNLSVTCGRHITLEKNYICGSPFRYPSPYMDFCRMLGLLSKNPGLTYPSVCFPSMVFHLECRLISKYDIIELFIAL